MMGARQTTQTRARSVSRWILALVCLLALGLTQCATTSWPARTDGPSASFFRVPSSWKFISEKENNGLYQADLVTRDMHGRMLVGKLHLDREFDNMAAYLHREHTQVTGRLRKETDAELTSEELVQWDNGAIGYRTQLRGELDHKQVIIDGLIVTDGKDTYFSYGLFTETSYDVLRSDYAHVLQTFEPLQGATVLRETAVSLAAVD